MAELVSTLTSDSAKAYILNSGTYWSAKELSANFKTTPANVNAVMKGLAQAGFIAYYYIPFELEVGGKKIEAKKYFYAKWSIKVPASFHLMNTQYANVNSSLNSQLVKPPKITQFGYETSFDHPVDMHKKPYIPPSETMSPLSYEPLLSWKGTYKDSQAYQYIPAKKKGKTPNEHVLAFFKHYHLYTFTMRFMAAYFDCTIGHISKVVKSASSIETWVWKGMNVASASKPNNTPMYIDWHPYYKMDPKLKIPVMNQIISDLEKSIEFLKFSGSISGSIVTSTKTTFSIPKLAIDPTKKIQFEVSYAKKATPVLDIGIASIESDEVAKIWGLVPLNLLRECADLYVLNDLSLDFEDVKLKFEEKRDFLAEQFARYLDMALGGELRDGFHYCSNWQSLMESRNLTILKYIRDGKIPHESYQRSEAQIAWKTVREGLGMKALEEVYQVFEFGDWSGASYGGKPWATAAMTLVNYLKGEYSKMIFVDTVWAMQHNCGFILNKAWNVKGLANVLKFKQEGCMVDLFKFASPMVAKLYQEKRVS